MSAGSYGDFISEYINYASDSTEPPAIFHRWAAIAGIGATLGREYYLNHGHFVLFPNMYCMLIGAPASRKSTAIKIMKEIMKLSGYNSIAAEKTTKEKFLMDLAGVGEEAATPEDFLEQSLFGEEGKVAEMFVMNDEFNDFFGNNILDFISLLGNLWDFSGSYESKLKNSKSLVINNPTISILSGNTPTTFSSTFPPEIFGQGFFSRILLIYSEPSGKKIAFPKIPAQETKNKIAKDLRDLKRFVSGEAKFSHSAELLAEKIYLEDNTLADVRFATYFGRRFSHLLKLSLIVSAARRSSRIEEFDILYANTMLTYAEERMPKALGEFGKSKNADVAHKVMVLINSAHQVLTYNDIWKHISSDLEKYTDLATIMRNLVEADKIQISPRKDGFLSKKKFTETRDSSIVDYSLLTEEEQRKTE